MPKTNSKTKRRKTVEKLLDPNERLEGDKDLTVDFMQACQELLEECSDGEFSPESGLAEISRVAKEIKIKPGFCVKTTDSDEKKVFLNICHCEDVQAPADISEDELREILISDEESAYRIPMSIGAAHEEVDKSGKPCFAYDVVIHTHFYKKMETSEIFKLFFVNVASEGVEIKYSCKLNREKSSVLRNKQFHGKMQKHFIRSEPKPLITELENTNVDKKSLEDDTNKLKTKEAENALMKSMKTTHLKEKPANNEKVTTSSKKPAVIIRKEPSDGQKPSRIIAEFFLTGHMDSKNLTLDVGEDRVVLEDKKGLYAKSDFYLPFNIDQEKCQAQFHQENSILTLYMDCVR